MGTAGGGPLIFAVSVRGSSGAVEPCCSERGRGSSGSNFRSSSAKNSGVRPSGWICLGRMGSIAGGR